MSVKYIENSSSLCYDVPIGVQNLGFIDFGTVKHAYIKRELLLDVSCLTSELKLNNDTSKYIPNDTSVNINVFTNLDGGDFFGKNQLNSESSIFVLNGNYLHMSWVDGVEKNHFEFFSKQSKINHPLIILPGPNDLGRYNASGVYDVKLSLKLDFQHGST